MDEAPNVGGSVESGLLWPPTEKRVNAGLVVDVEDDTDPNPKVNILVVSNEDAPGSATLDGGLPLSADRSGNGGGRIYLVVVTATDTAGNTEYDCCSIVVPHDKGKKSIAAVLDEADAAELACLAAGDVPAGFELVFSTE